jgi:hypothetical protein
VDPHANANRPITKRRLSVGRRRKGVGCTRERYEERIALGVDFDAAISGKRVTQEAAMVIQQIRVSIANFPKQPR